MAPPGLSGIRGLDKYPAFARSFYEHAAALRDAAPWDHSGREFHCFRMGATGELAARGQDAIVQIHGAGGQHFGLKVHPNMRGFIDERMTASHRSPAGWKPTPGTLELHFWATHFEYVAETFDVALMRRVGGRLSTARDPQGRVFPFPLDSNEHSRALKLEDLRLLEAAMALSVSFFERKVMSRPVPPPPYPTAYTFEPRGGEDETIESGYGCRGRDTRAVLFKPEFPPGPTDFSSKDRPWASEPSACCRVQPPPSVVTVGEKVAYHQAMLAKLPALTCRRVLIAGLVARPELNGRTGRVLGFDAASERYEVRLDAAEPSAAPQTTADGPPGGQHFKLRAGNLSAAPLSLSPTPPPGQPPAEAAGAKDRGVWRAHSFALANALWELEQEGPVARALELSLALLDEDFQDSENVRLFRMDLLLESGRWQEALTLLHRYARADNVGFDGGKWAWDNALLNMRVSGLRAKRSRQAVAAAIEANPHVYPLLVRDKPVENVGSGPQIVTCMRGMHTFGDEGVAQNYVWATRLYWWGLGGEEMIDALRAAGEGPYQEWHRRLAARASADETTRPPRAPQGGNATDIMAAIQAALADRKQHAEASLPKMCARCHKGGPELKKCQRCSAVVYCSQECQRADWKAGHKLACAPRAGAGGSRD